MSDQIARNEPADIPPELDRWNWGAFLLNWIWGIGNSTFIALLTLIPFVGFVMIFVLGAKGSKWAWRNRRWDSIEHFKRAQRLWAIWGVVIWLGVIVIYGGLFGSIFYIMKNSEAYHLGIAKLQASSEAANALGTPITTGIPTGSINISNSSGNANLSFSATGPKASGLVSLQAIKKDGIWSLKSMKLKVDGTEQVIDLLQDIRAEINKASLRMVWTRPPLLLDCLAS